jgi:hypothetical protein
MHQDQSQQKKQQMAFPQPCWLIAQWHGLFLERVSFSPVTLLPRRQAAGGWVLGGMGCWVQHHLPEIEKTTPLADIVR